MKTTRTIITYKYGAMNSAKSADLIRVNHNYLENGYKTLVLKPAVDSREKNYIISRVGIKTPAIEIPEKDITYVANFLKEQVNIDIILIDEAQFLDPGVIDTIVDYAYQNEIIAIFYGLRVDFRSNLFPGSKRLFEIADKIEEATSICWCGHKARQNARIIDGVVTKDGPTVAIDNGQNVTYAPLCNYHYRTGQIKK